MKSDRFHIITSEWSSFPWIIFRMCICWTDDGEDCCCCYDFCCFGGRRTVRIIDSNPGYMQVKHSVSNIKYCINKWILFLLNSIAANNRYSTARIWSNGAKLLSTWVWCNDYNDCISMSTSIWWNGKRTHCFSLIFSKLIEHFRISFQSRHLFLDWNL